MSCNSWWLLQVIYLCKQWPLCKILYYIRSLPRSYFYHDKEIRPQQKKPSRRKHVLHVAHTFLVRFILMNSHGWLVEGERLSVAKKPTCKYKNTYLEKGQEFSAFLLLRPVQGINTITLTHTPMMLSQIHMGRYSYL